MIKLLRYFLAFFISFPILAQKSYPDLDHPPIKIPIYLSGNFGEIRGNHFHTGLDIKTRGSEGYNLYAVWPGYVARIKVSPYGYGKALYIKHPNGLTTVYAHLKSFTPEIEAYVKSEQYRLKQSEIEMYPAAGIFTFLSGDKVALSGNSGSSQGPHLHFEIRDSKTEQPINPQLFNISVKDNVKPSIYGIKLEALNPQSGVESRPYRYYGVGGIHGDYTLNSDAIRVFGTLGLYVHSIDKYNDVPNSNGTYQISMKVNGQTHYQQSLNRLDFSTNRFINHHIDYALYRQNRKKYQKCFVHGYNRLEIYDTLVNNGHINIAHGDTIPISILAKDLLGNSSVLNFTLIGDSVYKNREKVSKNGLTVSYDREQSFNLPFATVVFPARTFYTNQVIELSHNDNLSDDFLSPTYTIGSDEIPVHSYYDIIINKDLKNTKGLFLATLDEKNKVVGADFIKKTHEQGFWFKTRVLGRYALMVDTIAPRIKPVVYSFNKNCKDQSVLRFTFAEDLTGLGAYSLQIDGQWALLEYDAKRKSLFYRCDGERLKPGVRKFELYVEDGAKNQAKFDGQFIFN